VAAAGPEETGKRGIAAQAERAAEHVFLLTAAAAASSGFPERHRPRLPDAGGE
jgi:hypothetical protein